ncbi:hypothetical protein BGI30_06760 [Snodgrassella alvi]|nr:hypothetical protein BGI30_06760 [Snodgrassella alvi]PIT55885.1 hypothetical protein BHC59_10285 [Snodgrassella alvi]
MVFAAVALGVNDGDEVVVPVVIQFGDGAGAVSMLNQLAVLVPAQVLLTTAGIGDFDDLSMRVVLVLGTLFVGVDNAAQVAALVVVVTPDAAVGVDADGGQSPVRQPLGLADTTEGVGFGDFASLVSNE